MAALRIWRWGVNALEGGWVNTVKTLTFEKGGRCMTPPPQLLWWRRPWISWHDLTDVTWLCAGLTVTWFKNVNFVSDIWRIHCLQSYAMFFVTLRSVNKRHTSLSQQPCSTNMTSWEHRSRVSAAQQVYISRNDKKMLLTNFTCASQTIQWPNIAYSRVETMFGHWIYIYIYL